LSFIEWPMQRILIIGCGGAGKSTLSRKLHAITGIPLIHLDQSYWQPNWVEPDKDDWTRTVTELIQAPSWIIDGNYGGTMDIRIQRADTIIFMDASRWKCLFRIVKRVLLNYGRSRIDMPEGCPEQFSFEFFKYIYHYNDTRRPGILEKLSRLSSTKNIVILSSNQAVKNYLKELQKHNSA
jgi:adenylate kinase family enzyme